MNEVPIGQGLFGECRIFGRCTCGLCADIQYGGYAKRGRPPVDRTEPKVKKVVDRKPIERPALPSPAERPIMVTAGDRKYHSGRKRKLPHLDDYYPTTEVACGCIMWHGRRVKWCYDAHTPDSHPNQ